MDFDISVFIPAIRTNRWVALYESLHKACKTYNWELVFVSPFDLPTELQNEERIMLIKDYGSVPRCVQKGLLYTRSNLFFLTVDDCTFAEDSLDVAINLYHNKCRQEDVVCPPYGEGGNKMEEKYWAVSTHGDLRLPGIPQNYRLANQCIMDKRWFMTLGGLDCVNFEYMDKPIHDFMFRLQYNGGKIYHSPAHCCIATWYPGHEGDHGPIHDAEVNHDGPIFRHMYSDPNILQQRKVLPYDNWKSAPTIWQRRFPSGKTETYEELCKQQNYVFKE